MPSKRALRLATIPAPCRRGKSNNTKKNASPLVLAIRGRGLHGRRQQALAQREDLLELPDHLGVEEASKLFGRYFKTCRLLLYCWCIRVKSY